MLTKSLQNFTETSNPAPGAETKGQEDKTEPNQKIGARKERKETFCGAQMLETANGAIHSESSDDFSMAFLIHIGSI